jgi:hypothetical protein
MPRAVSYFSPRLVSLISPAIHPQLPKHLTSKCPYVFFLPMHLLPTHDDVYFKWLPLTGPGGPKMAKMSGSNKEVHLY